MPKKILSLVAAFGLLTYALAFSLALPKQALAAISTWQKGATIQPRWNTDFGSASFQQSVDNLASTHANYVALVVPYYQTNLYTSDIAPGWNTPTDDSLISGIDYIHSKGMHVMLSIHVESNTGEWRANINPSDRASWYSNYGKMLSHIAQIAQQTGVEEISIGSEMIDTATYTFNPDNTQQWINLIDLVRGLYSGKLVYSANWGPAPNPVDEKDHIGFWSQLDYAGIEAYYNLNQAGDNSVGSLENAWNYWLNSDIQNFANNTGKPVLFTEIGYKSVTGSHNQPWDYNWGGPADQTEQANAYTALFDFWNNQDFMQGVFLWDWSSDPNAGGEGDTNYTPQNKQAQGVMQQWFGDPSAPNSNPTTNPGPVSTSSFNGPLSLNISATLTPNHLVLNQNTAIAINVTNSGGDIGNVLIDTEIYNSGGQKVFQQFFGNQSFAAGQARTYDLSWTPNNSDSYTVKLGVFSNDWSTTFYWDNDVATAFVGSGIDTTSTSVPPPADNQPPPSGNGTPSSIVMTNGYPTINGNYIDCNGNVDNDMAHHTTDPNDTDPAHHIGQQCQAGSFVATH